MCGVSEAEMYFVQREDEAAERAAREAKAAQKTVVPVRVEEVPPSVRITPLDQLIVNIGPERVVAALDRITPPKNGGNGHSPN
jgi:hypothetical protein